MARKKDNFDPLGGFMSEPVKSNKKSKRNNDVLGPSGYGGSSNIYDTYDYTDALTNTGKPAPEKKKKRGFFFGRKEKPQVKEEMPVDRGFDSGFDSSEYKIDINEGVMETGIIDRYAENNDSAVSDRFYERETGFDDDYRNDDGLFEGFEPEAKPAVKESWEQPAKPEAKHEFNPEPRYEPKPEPKYGSKYNSEVDFVFEEEDSFDKHGIRSDDIVISNEDIQNPLVHQKRESAALNPNVCYICGERSFDALPQFGFGDGSNPDDFVPLCKTCLHAVTTLMKYRDPHDEAEIIGEWRVLCPSLNLFRMEKIVGEGRKNH